MAGWQRWWPALAWWLCSVWLLLLKPAGESSGIPYFDKLGHFALFLLGGWLLACPGWRAGQQPAAVWRLSLALCLLWALGSELAQGLFTATRSAEAGDALADMLGAVVCIHLAYRAIAWRRPRV